MTTATTSAAALASIREHAGTQRARLLKYIASRGVRGASDLEAQAALGMSGDSERPRRGELLELRMIADSGMTRPWPKGRESTVWVATICGFAFSGESL